MIYQVSSLAAQIVKNLAAKWVRLIFIGSGRPLEKEKATHFSILAWKILWTKKPDGLQSTGLQRVRHD